MVYLEVCQPHYRRDEGRASKISIHPTFRHVPPAGPRLSIHAVFAAVSTQVLVGDGSLPSIQLVQP